MSYLTFEIERLRNLVAGCTTEKVHGFHGQLWTAERVYNDVSRGGLSEKESAAAAAAELVELYEKSFERRRKIEGGDNDSMEDMQAKLYQEYLKTLNYDGAAKFLSSNYGLSVGKK